MAGLYIHIPFCRRKCYYCDFYSVGAKNAPWQQLCDAIVAEAKMRRREWLAATQCASEPATFYVGGGTPSQMPPQLLSALILRLKNTLNLPSPAELTVELNPEDVSPQLIGALTQAGVNRVSLGIQSFSDTELRTIGRTHTAQSAHEAIGHLAASFSNVSLDLMFGLPGQDLESWKRSVAHAIEAAPTHISAYSLMWEERTALCKMQALGKVHECEPDLSVSMFELLCRMLSDAGYRRYEISNYALPGYESAHNSAYWSGLPYLGLGPGAHSYDGLRIRRANPADVHAYISHFTTQCSAPFYTQEHLCDEELREEYIMTRLRRANGIDVEDYALRFGLQAARTLIHKAMGQPHLLYTNTRRIALKHEGVMCSDSAILALI